MAEHVPSSPCVAEPANMLQTWKSVSEAAPGLSQSLLETEGLRQILRMNPELELESFCIWGMPKVQDLGLVLPMLLLQYRQPDVTATGLRLYYACPTGRPMTAMQCYPEVGWVTEAV